MLNRNCFEMVGSVAAQLQIYPREELQERQLLHSPRGQAALRLAIPGFHAASGSGSPNPAFQTSFGTSFRPRSSPLPLAGPRPQPAPCPAGPGSPGPRCEGLERVSRPRGGVRPLPPAAAEPRGAAPPGELPPGAGGGAGGLLLGGIIVASPSIESQELSQRHRNQI